ncbi:Hypothetical protein FKW44_021592 [Caligus rogercresseyi]|uniref:Uncharacterized protein n=1 Tax=Caligus rogercresseyi TaxID=217165 RepID=A0A7T8JVE4_CALRO|nr:Hypothetical protein FKW44_021592 [Caligus rogercresseyi]
MKKKPGHSSHKTHQRPLGGSPGRWRCPKKHERALEGGLGSEKLGQDEGADVNLSST